MGKTSTVEGECQREGTVLERRMKPTYIGGRLVDEVADGRGQVRYWKDESRVGEGLL